MDSSRSRGDHLAHGGLGIPQHLRRFGQTTQFDRLLQGNISVHFHITFLHIYIPNIYFTYVKFQYILEPRKTQGANRSTQSNLKGGSFHEQQTSRIIDG